jgi:hypothetical protein
MTERGLRNDRHVPTVEVVPSEPLPCLCTKGWNSGVEGSSDRGSRSPGVSGRSLLADV